MPLPEPEPGLVISYAYLWRHERQIGLDEGRKDRPCVIVLAVQQHDDAVSVTVAPITHRVPDAESIGKEIPPRIKHHLGLDHEKSWVVINEVNEFVWPGYDLRPIPGKHDRIDYGFLPSKLFEGIKAAMLELAIKRGLRITSRD
jgi:hypothetical protein